MAVKKPINKDFSVIMGTCVGSAGKKYDVWLEYKILSQNDVTLTSKIEQKLYLQRNDGFSGSAYNLSKTNYRRINEYSFNDSIDTRNNVVVLLASSITDVKHDVDGKKKYELTGEFFIDALGLVSGKASKIIDLPTINTKSEIEFNDFFIGDEINVDIKASNSTYVHELIMEIKGVTVLTRNNVVTNIKIKLSSAEENQIYYDLMPNELTTSVKITCNTYNSTGVLIGTTSKTRTIKLNPKELAPGYNQQYVQPLRNYGQPELGYAYIPGISIMGFNLSHGSFWGKKGSTLKETKVIFGSEELKKTPTFDTNGVYNGDTITLIPKDRVNIMTLVVTDSRGLETRVSNIFEISSWFEPKLINMDVYRKDGIGVETYLDLEIECFIGSEHNLVTSVLTMGYYTRVTEIPYIITPDKYTYEPTTRILSIKSLPIHLNGTSGGFPVGQEETIEMYFSIGVNMDDEPDIVLYRTPFPNPYKRTLESGKFLETYYKENSEYHRGYGGMPDENYNHKFYGNTEFNDDVIIRGKIDLNIKEKARTSNINTWVRIAYVDVSNRFASAIGTYFIFNTAYSPACALIHATVYQQGLTVPDPATKMLKVMGYAGSGFTPNGNFAIVEGVTIGGVKRVHLLIKQPANYSSLNWFTLNKSGWIEDNTVFTTLPEGTVMYGS